MARAIDPDAFKTKAEWYAHLGPRMADQTFARLQADATVERMEPRRKLALSAAAACWEASPGGELMEALTAARDALRGVSLARRTMGPMATKAQQAAWAASEALRQALPQGTET